MEPVDEDPFRPLLRGIRRDLASPDLGGWSENYAGLIRILSSDPHYRAEAQDLTREFLDECERRAIGPHELMAILRHLAPVLPGNEGDVLRSRALGLAEQCLGAQPALLANELGEHAGQLEEAARYEEAEALRRRAVDLSREGDKLELASALRALGEVRRARGDFEECLALWEEAAVILRAESGRGHLPLLGLLERRARLLRRLERWDALALNCQERINERELDSVFHSPGFLAPEFVALGEFEERAGRPDRALEAYEASGRELARSPEDLPGGAERGLGIPLVTLLGLTRTYLAVGRRGEAERCLAGAFQLGLPRLGCWPVLAVHAALVAQDRRIPLVPAVLGWLGAVAGGAGGPDPLELCLAHLAAGVRRPLRGWFDRWLAESRRRDLETATIVDDAVGRAGVHGIIAWG